MSSDNNVNTSNLFYDLDDGNSRDSSQGCSSQQDMFTDDANKTERKGDRPSKQNKKLKFHSVTKPPAVAVQEKIILCLDNSKDKGTNYSSIDLDVGSKTEPSAHIVRNEAVKLFITNKLTVAKDTEFAICSVGPGEFRFLSHFSSNIQHLLKALLVMDSFDSDEAISDFDITSIFNNVLDIVHLPESTNLKIIPPNYVIRVILLYSNSYLIPSVNTSEPSYVKFMFSPTCILDIFYLHERQSDFNNVNKIFKYFGKIISPQSYLLESSRNMVNVFNNMAKLLAHPYQRVNQQVWEF